MFSDWLEQDRKNLRDSISRHGVRPAGNVSGLFNNPDFKHNRKIYYLYVGVMNHSMLPIEGITPDYWVITGKDFNRRSWCCHGGTPVYTR